MIFTLKNNNLFFSLFHEKHFVLCVKLLFTKTLQNILSIIMIIFIREKQLLMRMFLLQKDDISIISLKRDVLKINNPHKLIV